MTLNRYYLPSNIYPRSLILIYPKSVFFFKYPQLLTKLAIF